MLILLGVYVVGAFASMARAWLFVLAGQRMVARLRQKLFGSVVSQDIAFFDTNRYVYNTGWSTCFLLLVLSSKALLSGVSGDWLSCFCTVQWIVSAASFTSADGGTVYKLLQASSSLVLLWIDFALPKMMLGRATFETPSSCSLLYPTPLPSSATTSVVSSDTRA